MREILNVVMSMYDDYNGAGMHMALFFACLIYLLVQKKDKDKQYVFLGYTLLFFIICFCPVTAKIIMEVCIEETVYWRMFWLLPSVLVTAYTAVLIIMQAEGKKKRYLLLGVMILAAGMTGSIVYNRTVFSRKENNYKLPQDAVDICDLIEADAAANNISHKKLITGNQLIPYIRQYDAQILMPYGMETIRTGRTENKNDAQIFRLISSDEKNWEILAWYAALENCNYLAYPMEESVSDELAAYGYSVVGDNGSYTVFRRDLKENEYEGEWIITQHGGADGSQLMFYTIQDKDGHLIVVDGGWMEDADYVRKIIKGLGNHVSAWLITHPHSDHAGAFTEIYKKPRKMKIDRVYAVDMADPEICLEKSPWDEAEIYKEWLKLDIQQLAYVHAGDVFEVEGLKFEIFNAYDDYVDELSNDLLNDGSMMFKITAKEESMLFCADVGKRMTDYLLDTYKNDLKTDYVQMGHHGNGGPKPKFYQFIEAKGAFFDAPNWLLNDTSGRYKTLKNVLLMRELGAEIYSYATTPNQIILK